MIFISFNPDNPTEYKPRILEKYPQICFQKTLAHVVPLKNDVLVDTFRKYPISIVYMDNTHEETLLGIAVLNVNYAKCLTVEYVYSPADKPLLMQTGRYLAHEMGVQWTNFEEGVSGTGKRKKKRGMKSRKEKLKSKSKWRTRAKKRPGDTNWIRIL